MLMQFWTFILSGSYLSIDFIIHLRFINIAIGHLAVIENRTANLAQINKH